VPSSKPFPNVISDNSRILALRPLQGPAASRHVAGHVVQESSVENSVVGLKPSLLLGVLYISEMAVAVERKALGFRKPHESFVPLDFVLVIEFHGALRHD